MTDFMEILRREVEATSITAVARKIGYARSSVSNLFYGRYPGSPHKIGAKIVEVFAAEIRCPHLNCDIVPAACREAREAPMPTNNARQLRHWTACQSCPNNPGPISPRLKKGQELRTKGQQNWWNK